MKSLEKELSKIDYTDEQVPDSVKNFRPDVYRDGDRFCVILGSGENAVAAYGDSIAEAMTGWDAAYWKKRYGSENK